MVVFTCNHCGDSLQKPKVEKHYQFQCRNGKNLTCVDCHKDFIGEDYTVHIKCISEEERYGAKGASNNTVKKGEVKQESWIALIQSIIASETNIKPHLKRLLETLSRHNNVPRKKNKFINFMKNAHGFKIADKDVEAVWNIIDKHKSPNEQNGENNNEKSTNHKDNGVVETNENIEKVNKKKKRKVDNNETESAANDEIEKPKKKKKQVKNNETNELTTETTEAENNTATGKFDFEAKVLDILNNKNTISLQKLEKKVTKLYSKEKGETDDLQKVCKKFHKKLNKMNNIVVENDTVTLKV